MINYTTGSNSNNRKKKNYLKGGGENINSNYEVTLPCKGLDLWYLYREDWRENR